MFCSECGVPNPDTNKFCTACGKPLVAQPPVSRPAAAPQGETIHMIVPYAEQGTIFTDAYTLLITSQRLIFAKVPGNLAPAFAEKEEEIDDEWVEIEEQAEQRSHLSSRSWTAGPWQTYETMAPEAIAQASDKTLVFPLQGIQNVTIVIDNEINLDDTLFIETAEGETEFSLKFAAGDRVAPLLGSLLGQRFTRFTRTEWEQMHRRRRF